MSAFMGYDLLDLCCAQQFRRTPSLLRTTLGIMSTQLRSESASICAWYCQNSCQTTPTSQSKTDATRNRSYCHFINKVQQRPDISTQRWYHQLQPMTHSITSTIHALHSCLRCLYQGHISDVHERLLLDLSVQRLVHALQRLEVMLSAHRDDLHHHSHTRSQGASSHRCGDAILSTMRGVKGLRWR